MVRICSKSNIPAVFFLAALSSWGQTPAITQFPILGGSPNGITLGVDGALWFTEPDANLVGRIIPSGTVVEYSVSGRPLDLALGPDGALWFTELSRNVLGRVGTNGQITEFSSGQGTPAGISIGPDGGLWFTEPGARQIGNAVLPAGQPSLTTGNTLTLSINLSFDPSFYGPRIIYAAARSLGDVLNSGCQPIGTVTVPSFACWQCG
jgi:streptogramin lyase